MRQHEARWLGVGVAALLGVATAAGCESGSDTGHGGGGGQGGTTAECVYESDCDDANPCTIDSCNGGQCSYGPQPQIAVPGQPDTPDDCQRPLCVDGQATMVPDEGDAPDDPTTGDCMAPACDAGQVTNSPVPGGTTCTVAPNEDGVCDDQGNCGCSAGNSAGPRYVDPALGTDDDQHGGAPDTCAYRSSSYALAHAPGEIILAPATYSAATESTWPIVLGDNQKITCPEIAGVRALLQGAATYATWSVVVEFTGENNGIVGCEITGGGSGVYCIDAPGTTSVAPPLTVADNDISGCINGIRTSVTTVELTGNTFHHNSGAGFFAQGPSNSVLLGNTFSTNGVDITCNDAFPSIGGSGNVGDGGAPTCNSCASCPFE